MPIYEYKCTKCNKQFDLLQKMSAPPIAQCPDCITDTAHRLVSAPSFQLKGDGWYVTDFKDKPANQNVKPDAQTASPTDPTTGSDAKKTTDKTQQESSPNKANDSKSSESTSNDSKTKAPQKPAKAVTEG